MATQMDKLVNYAILKGDIRTLEWARQKGYLFCPTAVEKASRTGNVELIRWMRAFGFTEGDPRWQKMNGIPWSSECAAHGALHAPTPAIARRLLRELQQPRFGATWKAATDADDCFRWNLIQQQPKGEPSLLVLPSRL